MPSRADGGPAFPDRRPEQIAGCFEPGHGMSLRAWLAGQAGMEAYRLLVEWSGQDWMGSSIDDAINTLTEVKLALADAMLDKLNKGTNATQTGETNEPTAS